MLMIISPAKTLDYTSPASVKEYSQPEFTQQAQQLVDILQGYSPSALAELMHLSDKLAGLNVARFAQWQPEFTRNNAKQALLVFKGDVYIGLDAESLTTKQLDYAQKHLRILSGLYGILRPLDLIQAYRLEMGTRLENPKGKDLYAFWGDTLTRQLNSYMQENQLSTLLNLASGEYFKSIKSASLNANLVKVDFKDLKNGQYKIISFYAKRARGLMARYIIEKQIQSVGQLQQFSSAGYYYSAEQSHPNHLVFLRDQPLD